MTWEEVTINLIVPFLESEGGNRYVMMVLDGSLPLTQSGKIDNGRTGVEVCSRFGLNLIIASNCQLQIYKQAF